MERHQIADEDVESSIDLIAKEYNKQDGAYASRVLPDYANTLHVDAVMKISVSVLQRVYEVLQGSSETVGSTEHDFLDPESHLFVIDAFEMPLWQWSPERGTFEQ